METRASKYDTTHLIFLVSTMYPFFEIYGIKIYTFWLTLTICFFLFFFLLKKFSFSIGANPSFFSRYIVLYLIGTLFFGRVFYILFNWENFKFLKPIEFFITNDYNFSLFWSIFGFLLILFILSRKEKVSFRKYLDVATLSFFAVAPIWYLWAFFWWQVYGKPTERGIEINSQSPISLIPYEVPIFPLAFLYGIASIIFFFILFFFSKKTHIAGVIGYMGILLLSFTLLAWETLSGKYDSIYMKWEFHGTQIGAICLILFAIIQLLRGYFYTKKLYTK